MRGLGVSGVLDLPADRLYAGLDRRGDGCGLAQFEQGESHGTRLLEQQVGCPDHRLGVQPADKRFAEQPHWPGPGIPSPDGEPCSS